ncbi:MAG: hypothetical protein AAF804_14390 [Bacteroidota bacterium]
MSKQNSTSFPPILVEAFDRLSKGQFISANARDQVSGRIYDLLTQREADLRAYFLPLGLRLEKGPGYYYLSRAEARSSLEDKLEKLIRVLTWLEWLTGVAPNLGPGSLLELAEWQDKVRSNGALRRKLMKLSLGQSSNPEDRVQALFKGLERESMVEMIDEKSARYRMLSAVDYLFQLAKRLDHQNRVKG